MCASCQPSNKKAPLRSGMLMWQVMQAPWFVETTLSATAEPCMHMPDFPALLTCTFAAYLPCCCRFSIDRICGGGRCTPRRQRQDRVHVHSHTTSLSMRLTPPLPNDSNFVHASAPLICRTGRLTMLGDT